MALLLAGCSSSRPATQPMPAPSTGMNAPSPDPRIGLAAGQWNAGEASWNMKLVSTTRASEKFLGVTNSDLAFSGKYAIQGNYNGFQVWDISNRAQPTLTMAYVCPASQSDVSVYKHLLFVSGEGNTGRTDCGIQGVPDSVSKDRLRGIRIFDATDMRNPKYIANVQTCRGSHTHTVVTDPNDPANVYIYVSGSARVRSPSELPGCVASADDPNTSLFRIEVIRVPLADPSKAAIVSSPRIFASAAGQADGLRDIPRRGTPAPANPNAPPRRGLTQCHDITVYPALGLAGGACEGMGLLLDIRNVSSPRRIDAVADSNFSYWHSATFSNDANKVLFSDEWGGGGGAKCLATDRMEWGADAIFAIENGKMRFKSYYKLPAAQTAFENCVAHNGSLIPVPGRDIMVQSWYQGGISVFDWTDAAHPREIAFFDRGPIDGTKMVSGGHWSAYWYNGAIVASEISRGLDILELTPSALLSQNEIDAAKLVQLEYFNAQEQPKFTWPAHFSVARAYLDQLERNKGFAADKIASTRAALVAAEKLSGAARTAALTPLAAQLHKDAASAPDQARAHMMAGAVEQLAGGTGMAGMPGMQGMPGMESSRAVAGGGISARGWAGQIDASETAAGQVLSNSKLSPMGTGLHVVTGPAVTYWNTANRATGTYTVKATFAEPAYMALNSHPHPYGIVIGGNKMGTAEQSYLYCAAYGNGNFIVRGMGPAPFQLNGGRGEANAAVNKAAGKGAPVTQEIAVTVHHDRVSCAINGTMVGEYPLASVVGAGKLMSTDGFYGIRFAHNTEAMVTGLSVTKH